MTSETRTLVLYHTLGCHLCEQAEQIAAPLARDHGWLLQLRDIADEKVLLERYSTRIPVLCDPLRGREIGWPFSVDEVCEFLGPAS